MNYQNNQNTNNHASTWNNNLWDGGNRGNDNGDIYLCPLVIILQLFGLMNKIKLRYIKVNHIQTRTNIFDK